MAINDILFNLVEASDWRQLQSSLQEGLPLPVPLDNQTNILHYAVAATARDTLDSIKTFRVLLQAMRKAFPKLPFINMGNAYHFTCLHIAAVLAPLPVVSTLLNCGADFALVCDHCQPFELAILAKRCDVAHCFLNYVKDTAQLDVLLNKDMGMGPLKLAVHQLYDDPAGITIIARLLELDENANYSAFKLATLGVPGSLDLLLMLEAGSRRVVTKLLKTGSLTKNSNDKTVVKIPARYAKSTLAYLLLFPESDANLLPWLMPPQ